MWFKRNKWKVIAPVLVMAVLAAAFFLGGAPTAAKGPAQDVSGQPSAPDVPVPDVPVPDVPVPDVPVPDEPAPDVSAPENTREQDPEQGPDPGQAAPQEPPAEAGPETGKDIYQTDPVPEGRPLPEEPQDTEKGETAFTCTLSVSCATILDNIELCDPEKAPLVPEDGWLLPTTAVTFYEGESVFDVLSRVCRQLKLHMEFTNTPIYNSAYVEGIGNLYEFDVGEQSGWMYKVNDWFPNYGCSRYGLKDGDVVCWVYTCDYGADVGGGVL